MYVDGFNLYHGLHAQAGRRLLWLDLVDLAERLRPRSDVVAVKYFTAPVLDEPDALSRQTTYLNALSALHGDRILIVNIAVTLVADAALGAMDAALLVSADSDLAPAVRTARRINPDVFITAAFPPQRRSAQLRQLMPASFPIKEPRLRQSLLPDEVAAPSGKVFTRPAKWR